MCRSVQGEKAMKKKKGCCCCSDFCYVCVRVPALALLFLVDSFLPAFLVAVSLLLGVSFLAMRKPDRLPLALVGGCFVYLTLHVPTYQATLASLNMDTCDT